MSSKHLRRLLKEKEKETICQQTDDFLEEEESPRPTANRFAFLGDDCNTESEEHQSDSEEPQLLKLSNAKKNENISANSNNKKNKKKKKTKKQIEDSEDEDRLLEKHAKENAESKQGSTAEEYFKSLTSVFKVDPRKFDPKAELKAILGKAFKDETTNKSKGRDNMKLGGRIVKQKLNWPVFRNIGFSMIPANEDKNEFKFVFNKHYEMLERMALIGERSMDIGTAQEILHSEYWHLHSLLLLANASLMQEDISNAMDLIERGIYFIEQNFHNLYDYTNLTHRIKYADYENRVYYLFLHKYVLLCVQKRCFETALNFSKLICTLDISSDPLAMFLMLDTLAIKAKKHDWLILLMRAYAENRKMDLLPNFSYSKALSAFLTSKTDEDRQVADDMLTEAIVKFPGVVTHLIEVLQILADSLVENNQFLNMFAYHKEQEGFKMVVKIYVSLSNELWKQSETLLWLERISRKVATQSNSSNSETTKMMTAWKEKRSRMFCGIPDEVKRLAVLLGISHEGRCVTDPIPPSGTVNKYMQEITSTSRDESLLAGFLNSLLPDFDPSIPLGERFQQLGLQQMLSSFLRSAENHDNNGDNQEGN